MPLLITALVTPGQTVQLEPIDQGIEDRSVLSESLRQVETGLGQPNDFSQLYRLPGQDRFVRIQGALYAVFPESAYGSGGVPLIPPDTIFYIGRLPDLDAPASAAQFDNEARRPLRHHPFVELGAGFDEIEKMMSGALPSDMQRARNIAEVAERTISARIDLRVASGPLDSSVTNRVTPRPHLAPPRTTEPRPRPEARTIVTDAEYRAQRLRGLMRRAATASLRD